MKRVLFLISFISLLSCDTKKVSKIPTCTNSYENLVVELSDGSEISFSSADIRPSIRINDDYEYFTLSKYDNNNKYVKVTFTRNIEFSESNQKWFDKLRALEEPYEEMRIHYPEYFKVYKVNANNIDIYTNEEATSDKYWYDNFDTMLGGTNTITLTIDQDYNVIDQSNEVLFFPDVMY